MILDAMDDRLQGDRHLDIMYVKCEGGKIHRTISVSASIQT